MGIQGRPCWTAATFILLAAASSLLAQTQDDLRLRIEALERELQSLKQQLNQPKAVDEKPKPPPLVTLGADGFSARSADSNFVLRLRATIQGDARFYPDGGPGTAKDTFLMRRVRPIIEGTVFERFDYRLMLDFGSGLTSTPSNVDFVQEAYATARLLPEFQIQAGKFKEPVGLERLKADTDMVFMERQYPTQLVPNRDVGLQLAGSVREGLVIYQVGVFNGVADGGSGDFETADGDKDLAARVFAQPFLKTDWQPLRGFGLGLGSTFGRQKGALRSFVSPGQQRFFAYRTGAGTNEATANVSADGDHWRLVPQAYYYWRSFGIFGEYAISNQRLARSAGATRSFNTVENAAWQVTASYLLTGDRNSFGQIVPKNPISFGPGGGWGAWELAAQVGQLSVDDSAFPAYANPNTSARRATSWGVGVNWYGNRNLKLMLDYEHTDFVGGQSTGLGAEGEEAILTRVQLAF